jgi:hypothetical protein
MGRAASAHALGALVGFPLWHVSLSRRLNGAFGGDPDLMLCAALWRSGSRWCAVIDLLFLGLRGERGHCRNASLYERQRRAGPVDRARLEGL